MLLFCIFLLFFYLLSREPADGLQMETSLLAKSGIFTEMFINMHCPCQINKFNSIQFLPLCDFPSTVIASPVPDSSHLCSPPSCINSPCFPLSVRLASHVYCQASGITCFCIQILTLFNCVFVTSLVSAFCYSFESSMRASFVALF